MPLVRALAESLNLATVSLGLDVGLPNVAQSCERLGSSGRRPLLPSMLLGAVDVTPLEVAQLYNALANGGFRTPLRAVRAVVDAQGKTLQAIRSRSSTVADPVRRVPAEPGARAGDGARHRRAPRARLLPAGLTSAGKTGTSSD